MAEFTLPLTAEGSVTAPSGVFAFIEPAAKSQTFTDVGPVNVLEIPEFGWALADGVNPLRLVTRSAVYDAGGLAPSTALTAAGTGARATATITYTAATRPNDGDKFYLGGEGGVTFPLTWKDTLSTSGDAYEVKRGANLAACISNLQALVNATGTPGTEFYLVYTGFGGPYDYTVFRDTSLIEVSATTATVITFRAKTYGTRGNSYVLSEITDGGASWAVATWSGGTNGTGTAPSAGTYRYFYTWYRAADGAETGRSPITTVINDASSNIAVSALTASPDSTFDYIRIYRTTNLGVEFYLVATNPRATTTLTDSASDTALATGIVWNELLHREYVYGQIPRGRALALWKGSVWSLGAHRAADYTKGTVAVVGVTTTPSATITFSVKGVSALMVGRTFQVDATSEEYTILSVDPTGPTAVLDRTYAGADNATATFKIKDDYDACAMRRCVPFLYNQWPVDESPGRVDTDDDEGGTALLATQSRLFGFSKTSIVAVTGDGPESWEISKVGQGIGCVAPRLVVGIDDGSGVVSGGMFLSLSGFYGISSDGSLVCVSSPKARKGQVAQGIDGTVARIAWANVDQGYSYFDPTERTVVFGVPLDGAVTPNYEIVFDLQNGTWTTFKRAEFTAATNGTLPGGGQFILTGDREGNLWHVDIGESDGFYGAEAVATLTSAQTVRSLTASGAAWTTAGDACKGMPFILLYANGTTVAYGKVASNTGTNIVPAEDLDTAPAAGDQLILGGIAWQAKSGFTTFGEEWRAKGLRSVMLRHAPTTRGEYYFSFAVDGGSFAVCPVGTSIGSLSQANGKVRHFTQWPGDSHAINLRGFKPGGRAVLRGGVFDLTLREVGRR